ncbi:PKD domain-containing protein [Halobium salinum]|uniref:PKD domain-containing protein n=1 Tax=Halobium salinum TaxID=1364940 RepID=A0ABD5P6Y5_9EURY|nr:PKD domain-containing protein [Halobium salinum]
MNEALTVALLLVVATLANVGVATPTNEAPLVDAGLDQTVERNTRIALDGTGTRDPDGDVVSYQWSIETPAGTATTPTDATDPQTSFTPTELGRYAVTLTATDDDGRERSDTLYVDVVRGDAPTVAVSGPARSTVGTTETYRANVSRGSAPLRRIVWQVDGRTVARRTVADGGDGTVSVSFVTPGPHDVTATVVDDDGLNATDAVSVRAERASPVGPSGGATGSQPTVADRQSPTVRGPKLLTGTAPFDSTYRLSGGGDAVQTVRWVTDRTLASRGKSATVSWRPGDHDIHAIVRYEDGSRDVAQFADGSTGVTVDPAPTVEIPALTGRNGLSGRGLASDSYGNLRSLDVSVDGRTVKRWPEQTVGSRGEQATERTVRFAVPGAQVNRNHTVVVTAVDGRGQRVKVSREVPVSGTPEVVRAEFVNGPVDSYHERLDPERYAAKHVLEIDLNGVPKENIDWLHAVKKSDKVRKMNTGGYQPSADYYRPNDTLVVRSYWMSPQPLESNLKTYVSSKSAWSVIQESSIDVQNSPPVLRLDVRPEKQKHYAMAWDVVVDASDSFDPDGDRVEYIWKHGATPTSGDNTTARFSMVRNASLVLRDGEGHATRKPFSYLDYIVPPIKQVEVVSEGPYRPNDTVRVAVETRKYRLSKNSYKLNLELGIEETEADIVEWNRHQTNPESIQEVRQWTGVIEVPASEFLKNDQKRVSVFNDVRPEDANEAEIPDVTVVNGVRKKYDGVFAENVRYVVEKPIIHKEQVTSQYARDRYLRRGYSVTNKETAREYVAKERVKIEEAERETRSRGFSTASMRRLFLQSNDEWQTGGIDTQTVAETVHETEWRSSRGGRGTFTGEMRRVKTQSANYRTKKQFEYTREIEHTGTREVTYWDTVTRTETYTKDITTCLPYGCFETTRTFTRTERDRVRRSYTDTYTYTTAETETYWSFSKYAPNHDFTGHSRQVKVRDARYETQYEFGYDRTVQRSVRTYHATRQVVVEPARYEWQVDRTFDDAASAYSYSQRNRAQIEQQTVVNAWTVEKQTGTSKEISSTSRDWNNVVETRADVLGQVSVVGTNPETGEERVVSQRFFDKSVSVQGVATKSELADSVVGEQSERCEGVASEYQQECSTVV